MLELQQIKEAVHHVAKEFPIKKAELFGSYANGNCHDGSDVDLLLEFLEPTVSLITISEIKCRLEEALKINVDLIHRPLNKHDMIKIDKVLLLYGA